MAEREVGKVFSYFSKIGVAAVNLTGELKVGDTIHIKGSTTDFVQVVKSMQSHNEEMEEAGEGDEIGIKVDDKVRPNDSVLLVEED